MTSGCSPLRSHHFSHLLQLVIQVNGDSALHHGGKDVRTRHGSLRRSVEGILSARGEEAEIEPFLRWSDLIEVLVPVILAEVAPVTTKDKGLFSDVPLVDAPYAPDVIVHKLPAPLLPVGGLSENPPP